MKRILSLALACLMILGLFSACGTGGQTAPETSPGNQSNGTTALPGNDNEEITRGGILNYSGTTITSWSPWTMIMRYTRLSRFVYESLGRVDENHTFQPYLADITPDQDNLAVTIAIHDGITFSDGSVLDAEALAWNLNIWNIYAPTKVGCFTEVEIKDDKTIVLKFDEWDLDIVNLLYSILVVSKKNYDDHAQDNDLDENGLSAAGMSYIDANPVGTGAFTFDPSGDDYQVDLVQKFRARSDYWQEGLPYLDAIYMYNTKEMDKLVLQQSFIDGEFHCGDIKDADTVKALMDAGVVLNTAYDVPYGTITGVFFNSNPTVDGKENPFHDVRVRQALVKAIDVDTILVQGFYNGSQRYVTHTASPYSSQYDDSLPNPYNLDEAIALLEEAGYTEANPLHVPITAANAGKNNCMILAQEWSKLPNVTSEVILVDYKDTLAAVATGSFYGVGPYGVAVDIDSTANFMTYFEASGEYGTIGQSIASENFTAAYKALDEAATAEERAAAMNDFMKVLYDEALAMPLYFSECEIYASPKAHNVQLFDYYGLTPEIFWLEQ